MTILQFPTPKSPAAAAKKTKAALNPLELAMEDAEEGFAFFSIDFSQVTRVTGDGAANGSNSDPVVWAGDAELKMRRIIAKFGLPRLPFTWGEMHGVLDYCLSLCNCNGESMPPEHRQSWRESARHVKSDRQPWQIPALDAYVAGDAVELLAIHTRERTIERVAAEWLEYEYEPGHPLFGIDDEA